MRVPTLLCVSLKTIISHHQFPIASMRVPTFVWPIPKVKLSKVWVYCRSISGIAGSNPSGVWMSLVSVVHCQVEASVTGRSPVERSPTECGVSECQRGTSYRGRRPTMAVQPRQEKRPYYTFL